MRHDSNLILSRFIGFFCIFKKEKILNKIQSFDLINYKLYEIKKNNQMFQISHFICRMKFK